MARETVTAEQVENLLNRADGRSAALPGKALVKAVLLLAQEAARAADALEDLNAAIREAEAAVD